MKSLAITIAAALLGAAPAHSQGLGLPKTHVPAAAPHWVSAGLDGIRGVNKVQMIPVSVKAAGALGLAVAGAQAPSHELDLAAALNGHLKKTFVASLGGKDVYVSGTFDKDQNAYLSAWVDGAAAPALFEIKGLLGNAGRLAVGGTRYSIYLEANALKPLRSRINFVNDADEDDEYPIRLGALLDKIEAAGAPLSLNGHGYRFYYMDGVKKNGSAYEPDPSARTVALILKDDGGEMHVFLIPESTIPGDRIALYKLHADRQIGLQKAGGKLRIYESP